MKLLMLMISILMCSLSTAHEFEKNVKTYIADPSFLTKDPYKKTKSVVELNGIHNEFELQIVKSSINNVIRFIRLLGMTNKLPEGKLIWEDTRMHPYFMNSTTSTGREELDIAPATNRLAQRIFNWKIDSTDKLSVDVELKHTPLSSGPTEVPSTRIYRLIFVKGKCAVDWCLDGAKRLN